MATQKEDKVARGADLSVMADALLNREYDDVSPNGLGFVTLKKTKSAASQIVSENTIYEIRYDYDISGGLTIPSGCILRFVGGKFSNGTLTGNLTKIEALDVKIFDNITFAGSFYGALNASWIGARAGESTFDNSAIIQKWFDSYCGYFKVLKFTRGTYYFLSTARISGDGANQRNLVLDGGDSLFRIAIPDDENENGQYFLSIRPEAFRIQNIRIANYRTTNGVNLSKTRGILFTAAQRFHIENVQFWYFDVGVVLNNIWYGGIDGNTFFTYCRVGLMATVDGYSEVNTVEVHNINFKGISRATVAEVYPQKDGESSEDYLTRTACCGFDAYCLLNAFSLRGCVFEGLDYGVRTNWRRRSSDASMGTGVFLIDNCYFEANRVYDIYTGSGNMNSTGTSSGVFYFVHQITISNCRFFTLKKVHLFGVKALALNNEPFTVDVKTNSKVSVLLNYTGPITLGEVSGGSFLINKLDNTTYSARTSSGTDSTLATNFQRIQATRGGQRTVMMQNGYSFTATTSGSYPVAYNPNYFQTVPEVKYAMDVHPDTYYYDPQNGYYRLLTISGDGLASVRCDSSYNFRTLNCSGGISLYEFLRRWKAGTTYTGTVQNLFPYRITADPVAGTVTNVETSTIVGFGVNALGTTITNASSTGYYIFVDALVGVRISNSRIKQYADILQCGRTYAELRGTVDVASSQTAYLSCWGPESELDNVQKRLNAVYYDTTNSTLKIYNGFGWVPMTSAFQRYYYNAQGASLSERATMADYSGQTFHNYATGITYTFSFRAPNSYRWVSSIGSVDSLDHPNGYNSDESLDYINELSVGELVMYDGKLYTWNGTELIEYTNVVYPEA